MWSPPCSKATRKRKKCNCHWSPWLMGKALRVYHWVFPLPGSPSWYLQKDPGTTQTQQRQRTWGQLWGALHTPTSWKWEH